MKAKPIREIIKRSIVDEGRGTIEIDDGHFFSDLINNRDELSQRRLTAFLLLLVVMVACVVAIIASLMFFVNDVLLYSNTPTVNQGGSTVLGRSCERESMLFLFNSADMWADTGISLRKGDRFRISYSGGFNSDVDALTDAAQNNQKPKHGLTTFARPDRGQNGKNRTLYTGDDSYFGSLIYSIAGEDGVGKKDRIFQITQEKESMLKQISGKNRAKKGGRLYLSVNDIYLTDEIIGLYKKDNCDILKLNKIKFDTLKNKDSLILRSQFNTLKCKDSIELYLMKGDSIWLHDTTFEEHFKQNRDAFFNDNIGEVLVLVEIDRKVPFFGRISWYRWTESHFNNIWDRPGPWPLKLIIAILFLVIALIWLVVVKLCWITLPLVGVLLWMKWRENKKNEVNETQKN
jgi:hypothetical protein